MQNIAEIIQNERRKKGITQAQLAKKVGVSDKTISNIETRVKYKYMVKYELMFHLLGIELVPIDALKRKNIITLTLENFDRFITNDMFLEADQDQFAAFLNLLVFKDKHGIDIKFLPDDLVIRANEMLAILQDWINKNFTI